MENEQDYKNILLNWTFPEFESEPRSNAWYLWYGIITALLVMSAILTDNYLFAVIIVLFTLILFLYNWRKPEEIQFAFSGEGMLIGEKLYSLKEIEEFWIVYEPPVVERVYFEFKSPIRPVLGIPLQGENPLQVREVLLEYLSENLDKDEEPFSDGLARVLKL